MRLRHATALVVPYYDEDSLNSRIRDTNAATPEKERVFIGGLKYAELWQRMFFKIKVRRILARFTNDIVLYGTSSGLTDLDSNIKPNFEQLLNKKLHKQEEFRRLVSTTFVVTPWYILTPKSYVRRAWVVLMALLLFYTVTVLPVRVAFYDTTFFDVWAVLDIVVDLLFAVDILMNCLFSFYSPSGVLEIQLNIIAARYLKTWFFLDLCSCFPYTLLEYTQDEAHFSQTKLLKLVRLSRLYKVMKYFQLDEGEDVENTWFNRVREYFRSEWSKGYLRTV